MEEGGGHSLQPNPAAGKSGPRDHHGSDVRFMPIFAAAFGVRSLRCVKY